MKKRLAIALLSALTTATPSIAENDNQESWHVEKYSATQASLYYGAENNDELLLAAFSCDAKTQTVSLLIREISTKAKPDENICTSVTKDGETMEICGQTIANELAGIPDFEANTPHSLPLFTATADEAKAITVTAMGESFKIPLKGFNAAQHDFGQICFGR